LSRAAIYSLSDLDKAGREAFRAAWPLLSEARRRDIVSTLVNFAEDNIDVDFNFSLRVCLEDADEEVRVQAINGLWEDESDSLIGPLMRRLAEDSSERVRAEAADSLGRFILFGELGDLDTNQAFATQEALLRAYNNPHETLEVRSRALESLGYSEDEAIHDLIEAAYTGPDERLVASAVLSMGRSADPRWRRIVMRELDNSNPEIRFQAARACGGLEASDAVRTLGEMAQQDPDDQVRAMAIRALGQIGGNEARRILDSLVEVEENAVILEALAGAMDELDFADDILDMPLYDMLADMWEDDQDGEDDEDDGDNGDSY
jgi:HEAT repeat protein